MVIVYIFIWAFGFWTILCNAAFVCRLDLSTLQLLSPLPLVAGVVCGVLAARRTSATQAVKADPIKPSFRWPWLIAAFLIAAMRFADSGYRIFWLASVLFLSAWLLMGTRSGGAGEVEPRSPIGKKGALFLSLMAVISAGFTYVAHRPDADDSFFVGVISDAVAHPNLPVLGHDPLYGGDRFPLILPTYAVDSMELFTAMLARTFGGDPIIWAHAIVPTFFGALLPLGWAFFMRNFTSRWMMATVLALMLLALLGEDYRSLGNFAFVRMFQGKSVLVSLGIPILFACVWEFQESGRFGDWATLFFCTVASLGLSSSGIFVVPLALGIAAVAAWEPNITWRTLAAILPAAYPLGCGVALKGNFSELTSVLDVVHPSTAGMLFEDFGHRGQIVLLFGLLAAPMCVQAQQISRKLAVAALLFFIGPLDPLLLHTFIKLLTTEAIWRILWSLPTVGFLAITIIGIGQVAHARWGRRGIVVAGMFGVAIGGVLARHATFLPSNYMSFSFAPYKLPARQWETAQTAAKAAPPGMAVVAPEEIAEWIPLLESRPDLVSIRSNYDDQMGVRMPTAEALDRRQLRELMSGYDFPQDRIAQLLNALPKYNVGLIVCEKGVAHQLNIAFTNRGYREIFQGPDYVFYVLSK